MASLDIVDLRELARHPAPPEGSGSATGIDYRSHLLELATKNGVAGRVVLDDDEKRADVQNLVKAAGPMTSSTSRPWPCETSSTFTSMALSRTSLSSSTGFGTSTRRVSARAPYGDRTVCWGTGTLGNVERFLFPVNGRHDGCRQEARATRPGAPPSAML
jgi:hypothetical protein